MITSISPIYKCPTCKKEYGTENEALSCFGSDQIPEFKVGDIVHFGYRFGWFDGAKNWLMNNGLPLGDFNGTPTYGFFYVITHLEVRKDHRVMYHVATNAMSGEQGYKGGYTCWPGHNKPNRVESAPLSVLTESKNLLGMKFENLL